MSMETKTLWSVEIAGKGLISSSYRTRDDAQHVLNTLRTDASKCYGTVNGRVVFRVVNTVYGDWRPAPVVTS